MPKESKAAEKLKKLKEERARLEALKQKVAEKKSNKVAETEQKKVEPKETQPDKDKKLAEPSKKKEKFSLKKLFKLPKKKKKDKKHKRTSYEQQKRFSVFIRKAGFEADFSDINQKILIAAAVPIVLGTLYILIDAFIKKSFILNALTLLVSFWILGSLAVYFVLWIFFFIYIDLKIVQRRKQVEAVFPDFLQLTAANINAGMPIDRALWFAIRPRFGILAREMETVAKATMVGENLGQALRDFANRYDSVTIKRSINLLLEGLESGGEVGDLLIKVANNIRETELIKKEMASSVTTYVIFILFATLGAAPFLFGLTTQLIVIMKSILGDIDIASTGQSIGGVGAGLLSGSGASISVTDYQIFAVTSIVISTVFASIIISVIQKGNATDAIKKIPLYTTWGIINYFVAFKLLNLLLSGFFS